MGKQWKQCHILFWGSKITADGDYGHEIKRLLLLGRKVMTNLGSILKSRDYLSTKIHLVKALVFAVIMYGYESWTIKKAECQRTDASELCPFNKISSHLQFPIRKSSEMPRKLEETTLQRWLSRRCMPRWLVFLKIRKICCQNLDSSYQMPTALW